VLNLLDNAVKYGPREQAIVVRVHRQASEVVVSVADQGEGIPTAERSKAFVAFARLERAGTLKVPGTGIGLAVVRELVSALGGRVWVEDVFPDRSTARGARFSFTLPAAAGIPAPRVPRASAPLAGRA
jgi:two-component system, OmpR family, sensor histidine kinase VicK